MSSKKQTAVEWLIEQILPTISETLSDVCIKELIEISKAMEKEQIIDAHLIGLVYPLEIEATKQAEQYYTSTYEK